MKDFKFEVVEKVEIVDAPKANWAFIWTVVGGGCVVLASVAVAT